MFLNNIKRFPLGPVELAAMCIMASTLLSHLGFQNILLRRVCEIDFGFDPTKCEDIVKQRGKNKTDEAPLQQAITDILTIRALVDGLVPVLILLLMGSYSDQAGRKLPMILPLVGYIIQAAVLISMTQLTRLDGLSMSLISALIRSLSGSELAFVMAACSYISDSSDKRNLSWNLGLFEGAYNAGLPLAFLIQGFYNAFGLHEVFTVGTGMVFGATGLALILFCFEDSSPQGGNHSVEVEVSGKCSILTDAFTTLTKNRPGHNRLEIWSLILAYACICGPIFGEFPLLYLFLRERLSWDIGQFSYFQLYVFSVKSLGAVLTYRLLLKLTRYDDAGAATISGVCQLISCIIYAFSFSVEGMVLAATVDLMNNTIAAIIRSMMTKRVENTETGKLNAFLAILNSILPVILMPLYNNVYKQTVEFFSGGFNILSAVLTVPALLILIWFWCRRNDPEVQGEEQADEGIELRYYRPIPDT